jgi:pyruvate dehydrogenase E2 component (dihydrolipoamide acetyltransferase)
MGPVEAAEGRRYRGSPSPRPAVSAESPSLPGLPGQRRQARPRIKASPVARRIAEEEGLDRQSLLGSGPGGRIVKADVETALASGSVPTATLFPPHQEKAPSPFLLEESASNPAQAGNEVTPHTISGPPPAPFAPASASAGLTPGAVEKPLEEPVGLAL